LASSSSTSGASFGNKALARSGENGFI
jgi:hypothetical protein